MNGTSGFQKVRSSKPDHQQIGCCTSNGIDSEQVPGSCSVLTISSLSPQALAQCEKRFLTPFILSNIVDDEATAAMFVQQNWGSLSQDIARGNGEHLASLAHLMGIPEREQETFYTEAQQRYAMLSQEGHVTPDLMLVALRSRNVEGIR